MYSYLMQKPDYISPALPHAGALRQREKLGATLRSWFGSVLRRWKQMKLIAELEALDDRLLMDIGIPRNQIRNKVVELFDSERNMTPMAASTDHSGWKGDAFPLAA